MIFNNEVSLKKVIKTNQKNFSKKDCWQFVNYLDTGNITENSISEIKLIDLKKEKLPSRAKRKVSINNIIYSTVRPNQKHFGFINRTKENFIVSTGFCVIEVDEKLADSKYIYYFLTRNSIIESLQSIAEQSASTYPAIKATDIEKIKIKLPNLPTQKKIASILSDLDDKIELNNKINKNLEEMAQAIFKSWFVDFEPFQTSEFTDSEYGRIPFGWKFVELGKLCEIVTKGTTPTTLKKQFSDTGVNFIKAESILNNHSINMKKLAHIDDETNQLLSRSKIKKNDIVYTIAGTLGRFSIIDNSILPANSNQAVAIIRANTEKINPYVLYSYFIGDWQTIFFTKHIQQAVQANLSLTTIKALPILLPPAKFLIAYKEIIIPLFSQIQESQLENCVLSKIRDTLLSKLMSGELDVSNLDI